MTMNELSMDMNSKYNNAFELTRLDPKNRQYRRLFVCILCGWKLDWAHLYILMI